MTVDVAPELATLAESNKALDTVVDELEKLQADTGKKLRWGTAVSLPTPVTQWVPARLHSSASSLIRPPKSRKPSRSPTAWGGEGYTFWVVAKDMVPSSTRT